MKFRVFFRAALAVVALLAARTAMAEVKLPSIISSGMVLQRDQPIPIWGWDEPGVEVSVTVGDAVARAKAGEDGKWMVKLPAMKAGGPHTVVVKGTNTVSLEDVLVGEVWLCSGQSNMEWSVQQSNNAQEEIKSANFPLIRHIKVPHVPRDTPQNDVATTGWKPALPENVASFTAVGYYFGRHLHQQLNVPIGLIGSNWGGTRIEPWTPPVGFEQVPALKEISENISNFPAKNANGAINHQSPTALYNGMIAPLVPYGIRGAIWYQGESNRGDGMLYFEKKKALIAGWRSLWNNDKLPFYFVQLAPYTYGGDNPTALPEIWEAQTKSLSIPYTGMAVTVDIGNVKNIHPTNKQDVGKRLALWALAHDYGQKGIVYSGPLFKSMKVEGDKAVLSFEHVGSGLISRDGEPLTHFQIAGDDRQFVDARADVVGETVVVSAEGVAKPVAVRFGWHQLAEPNLSNKEGLPASPFRTDNWTSTDSAAAQK